MSKKSKSQAKDTVESEPTVEFPPEPAPEPPVEVQSLAKVRDILFGSQARGYERRFDHVESRLTDEQDELRRHLHDKLQELEEYIKAEVGSVVDQLRQEERRRSEAFEILEEEVQALKKALEKRLDEMDNLAREKERDFRDQLLQSTKKLREELDTRSTELRTRLDRDGAELRHSKVDRSSLASMLTDLAVRMADQESESD